MRWKVLDACPALPLSISVNGGLSFRVSWPQFPLGQQTEVDESGGQGPYGSTLVSPLLEEAGHTGWLSTWEPGNPGLERSRFPHL